MSEDILFKQTDPTGYEVWLSSEQYERHIIRERQHTEIKPEHIQKVIAAPLSIYKGTTPNTREYFGVSVSFPKFLTQVSVAEYEDYGDVRTAYTVKEIGGKIVPLQEGGCLYVSISNKL